MRCMMLLLSLLLVTAEGKGRKRGVDKARECVMTSKDMNDRNYRKVLNWYRSCVLAGLSLPIEKRAEYANDVAEQLRRSAHAFLASSDLPDRILRQVNTNVMNIYTDLFSEREEGEDFQLRMKLSAQDDGMPVKEFHSTMRSTPDIQTVGCGDDDSDECSKPVFSLVLLYLLLLLIAALIAICVCFKYSKKKDPSRDDPCFSECDLEECLDKILNCEGKGNNHSCKSSCSSKERTRGGRSNPPTPRGLSTMSSSNVGSDSDVEITMRTKKPS